MRIATVAAIWLASFSHIMYSLFVLPFSQVQAYTLPYLFSTKKMRFSKVLFISSRVISPNLMGLNTAQ